MRAFLVAALASVALPGCSLYLGSGDDDIVEPPGDDGGEMPRSCTDRPIVGGGGAGGFGSSVMNVCVVDERGAFVDGATVQLADGAAKETVFGAAAFTGLEGAQTFTITAPDFVPTTWSGVLAPEVTVPIRHRVAQTATARGSIALWNQLPAPAAGHYHLAVVDYSKTPALDAYENNLPQTANTCRRTAGDVCAWELAIRTGNVQLYATILDGDRNGTPDEGDDTFELAGYAIGYQMTVEAGADLRLDLPIVPPTQLATLDVAFPAEIPADLDDVAGVAILDVPETGRLVFSAFPATPERTRLQVIAPPVGTAYDVAEYARANDRELPYALTVAQDAGLSSSIPPRPWPVLPRIAACGQACWRIANAAVGTLHTATFSQGGEPAWDFLAIGVDGELRVPVGQAPLRPGPTQIVVRQYTPPTWSTAEFTVHDLFARSTGGGATRYDFDF
jgi:hypothetical protein